MQAQSGTTPERELKKWLRRQGLRYRLQYQPIPGTRRVADIAFPSARVAVFVDGCFWHGCPEHGRQPKANSEWWSRKLAATRARDRETDRLLAELEWLSVRVWEHQDPEAAAEAIAIAVRRRLS
jgi:DNA mismatch endonuclease (patch repair protein)